MGPSGGGKTTFAKILCKEIGMDASMVLEVENYWQFSRAEMAKRKLTGYHWETRDKNRFMHDLQQLKNNQTIHIPVFDAVAETPTNKTTTVIPKDIIILEDTLDLSEFVDIGVYVLAPDDVLIERRIKRDAAKTGFNSISELETYIRTNSLPAYKTKLLPSIAHADFVYDTHSETLYQKQ
jgi:uridine kinase